MIEDIAEKIVDIQIKKPKIILIIVAIVTLLLIPGLFNIIGNVEPSLEKVLPEDIEVIKTMNQMRSDFGADMTFLVITTDYDIRDPSVLKYIEILKDRLLTHENILEINSMVDIVKQYNENQIPDSIHSIRDILKNDPRTDLFVNYDKTTTVVKVRTDTGASAELIGKVINNMKLDIEGLEQYNPNLDIQITGFNAIDKATFEVIISDFKFITIVSLIAIMIIVYFTFGSLTKGMLPMIVVMFALTWTAGIVGYLNMTITVVSMVASAMIMGLGIDFGIHIVHTYYENEKKYKKEIALKRTMTELLRAMIAASLTTSAGFLALVFGVLPAMKTLGIILAIGIINTLLAAAFLLPIIVFYYDSKFGVTKKSEISSATHTTEGTKKSEISSTSHRHEATKKPKGHSSSRKLGGKKK